MNDFFEGRERVAMRFLGVPAAAFDAMPYGPGSVKAIIAQMGVDGSYELRRAIGASLGEDACGYGPPSHQKYPGVK